MEYLLLLVPVLGCAVMMLTCAAMMWGGHRLVNRRTSTETATKIDSPTTDDAPAEQGDPGTRSPTPSTADTTKGAPDG